MPTLSLDVPVPLGASLLGRSFDALAMGIYPWFAAALGYRFAVGTDPAVAEDGRGVLRAVWGAMGVVPPPEIGRAHV